MWELTSSLSPEVMRKVRRKVTKIGEQQRIARMLRISETTSAEFVVGQTECVAQPVLLLVMTPAACAVFLFGRRQR
jgi:hypothetical protein